MDKKLLLLVCSILANLHHSHAMVLHKSIESISRCSWADLPAYLRQDLDELVFPPGDSVGEGFTEEDRFILDSLHRRYQRRDPCRRLSKMVRIDTIVDCSWLLIMVIRLLWKN